MQQLYVFGYGSLMNPKSVARTIPGEREMVRTRLKGYQRRMNVPYGQYLYLNIAPREDIDVVGTVIPVTPEELEMLKVRESGYDCVDVTDLLEDEFDGIVYSFIAPDIPVAELKVPRSYILTCLDGIPAHEREQWLAETILENEIEEDVSSPVYENLPEA